MSGRQHGPKNNCFALIKKLNLCHCRPAYESCQQHEHGMRKRGKRTQPRTGKWGGKDLQGNGVNDLDLAEIFGVNLLQFWTKTAWQQTLEMTKNLCWPACCRLLLTLLAVNRRQLLSCPCHLASLAATIVKLFCQPITFLGPAAFIPRNYTKAQKSWRLFRLQGYGQLFLPSPPLECRRPLLSLWILIE